MELEQLKEKYESGDYVCYALTGANTWIQVNDLGHDDVQLIHKKHKVIADSIIANPDVEVVEYYTKGSSIYEPITDFFNHYNEYRLYGLKPKEKEDGQSRDASNDTSINDVHNNTISTTAEDGTAITRVEVIGKDGREFSKMLNDAEYEISMQDDGRTIKLFEKPIKKPWYEIESNFPCLMKTRVDRGFVYIIAHSYSSFLDLGDSWRPATKEEVLSLVVDAQV